MVEKEYRKGKGETLNGTCAVRTKEKERQRKQKKESVIE